MADPVAPVSDTAPRPVGLGVWVAAARPKTLWAAVAPVIVGVGLALGDGVFHPLAALCALAGAVFIQIGTNYVNDSEDALKGADTEDRKGPMRAVATGLVSPGAMRVAAGIAFALAFASGGYLIARGGVEILILGLVCIASGVAYTAGKYALAYTGLADLFVLVFFGPVAVAGTYYVQALALPSWVPIAGLGPGALATAILLANNVRDVNEDRIANKMTLVVRFGRNAGVALYSLMITVAVMVPAAMVWVSRGHLGALAASAIASLAGRRLATVLARNEDPAVLNPLLGKTALLLLVYSLAFALGWWLT